MDVERIKEIYDRFEGNPDAMEEYIARQLQEAVFSPSKPAIKIPEGYEVTLHRDENCRLIDITFERIN